MQQSGQQAYLGVDAGGTRTRAVLSDPGGGRTQADAGPANWTTLGQERCVSAIGDAVRQVLAAHGVRTSDLAGVCVALAGYYPAWHHAEVLAALSQLLPDAPLRVVPDLVAAWAGATGGRPGVVLVAGTGSVAYGRNSEGQSARAGGWGPLFGDEGGGYWIGCKALRAVARSLDGRGPSTSLAEGLWLAGGASATPQDPSSEAVPCRGTEENLRAVYRDQWPRDRIAGLAAAVLRAAADGDAIAISILTRAAAELSALVTAVAGQLSWGTGRLSVMGVGGVLEAGTPIREPLERRLAECLPNAVWRSAQGSPLEGALFLAQAEEEP